MGSGLIRRLRLVALAGALVLVASACWGSYGSDYANTRVAKGETLINRASAGSLHELWRIDGTVGSTSTPAVAGDTVYFGAWDGTLRAVWAIDGSPRWTRQLTTSVVDDSPLVFGNNVYVGDGTGNLHAVDRATGVTRWSRDLDPHPYTRIFSSPVGVEGLIVVGVASFEIAIPTSNYTARGSIVGLDANTGAVRWRVYTTNDDANGGAGVSVWSTAAIDQNLGLAFIGTGNTYEPPAAPRSDALMAIDYRTGDVEWVRQFTAGDVYTIFGPNRSGPDADIGAAPNLFKIGDREVVGVGDKAGVYATLDRRTGETIWARRLPTGSHLGGIMTTAAYANNRLYLSSNTWADQINLKNPLNRSTTYSLDASTGAIVWSKVLPSATFGALTYANGVVFQPTINGTVYAFDARDGTILWSDEPGGDLGSGVSVANGRVFAPFGFWFLTAPANPNGGIVAYGPE